jgi:hypothetical protein
MAFKFTDRCMVVLSTTRGRECSFGFLQIIIAQHSLAPITSFYKPLTSQMECRSTDLPHEQSRYCNSARCLLIHAEHHYTIIPMLIECRAVDSKITSLQIQNIFFAASHSSVMLVLITETEMQGHPHECISKPEM